MMNLYYSKTYMDDLDRAADHISDLLASLVGKSVLITGATGLICSAIADLLFRYNETHNANITILIAGRNEQKAKSRFNRYWNQAYSVFVPYDASKDSNDFAFKCDYIIHGASNAYPALIQAKPVETMADNFLGMKCLLEYAKENHVSKTVFISSSEVYGKKQTMEPFTEDEYGFLDILNPRLSYAESKRAAETLCASYAYECNVPVSIIRPGHIYGPTASRSDNRVSSSFAYDAADGKNLVLKSDGAQIRSYCYMLDAATAILTALLKGDSGAAYNISNPDSVMSIREIATLYAKYGSVELKFEQPTDSEKAAFNPMQNSSLNSEKLQALGWRGLFDSKTGTEHTVKIIRECQKKSEQ